MPCNSGKQDHCPPEIIECSKEMIWSGCYECESNATESNCLKSNTGFYLDGTTAKECAADQCCPVGSTMESAAGCTSCDEYQTQCLACGAEYARGTDGLCAKCAADQCCPAGSTTETVGACTTCSGDQSKCDVCKEGYMSGAGSFCTKCAADQCCPAGSTPETVGACTTCADTMTECMKCTKEYKLIQKVCVEKKSGAGTATLTLIALLMAVAAALL